VHERVIERSLGQHDLLGNEVVGSPAGSRVKEPSGAYTRPDVIDDDDEAILVENSALSNALILIT
jgi:hypothetical protein